VADADEVLAVLAGTCRTRIEQARLYEATHAEDMLAVELYLGLPFNPRLESDFEVVHQAENAVAEYGVPGPLRAGAATALIRLLDSHRPLPPG
jgi:hypothetical protein